MPTPNHARLADYPGLYTIADDGIKLVLDAIPGTVTQEKTLNVALLVLYGNHLAGIDALPSKQISVVCQDFGCLDAPHFMRTLKQATHLLTVTGTRRRYHVALTPQGITRAQQLVAALQQQPPERFTLLVLRPNALSVDCEPFEARGFRVSTAVTFGEARKTLNNYGIPDALLIKYHAAHKRDATRVSRYVRTRSDTPIIVAVDANHGRGVPLSLREYSDKIIDTRQPAEKQARLLRAFVDQLGSLPRRAQSDIEVDASLRVDLVERKASLNGNSVGLSPLEARILHIFLRRKGETLSVAFIGGRLGFDMDSPGDRSRLTVYISRLRKKLMSADSLRPNYIESQYGSGYRFVSPLGLPTQPDQTIP